MSARELELAADQLRFTRDRGERIASVNAAAASAADARVGWPPRVGDTVLDLPTLLTGEVLGAPIDGRTAGLPYHVKLSTGAHAVRRLGELEKPKAPALPARK